MAAAISPPATATTPGAGLPGDAVAGGDGTVENVAADPEEAETKGWRLFMRRMTIKLEKYQPQIQELPGFVWARETAENYLQDDENR
ncbi:MAG: hypothetical protein QGF67_02825, partial [Lentisphaeria bacterium]|nr:hypothetical protein [Lentisphaeria bacterium]